MRTGPSLRHTAWRSEYIFVVIMFELILKPRLTLCWLKVVYQLWELYDVNVWCVVMTAQKGALLWDECCS